MFREKGFTLIEVVLAVFIIGVALVTLLSMLSMGLKGDVLAREVTVAGGLAREMMEEIKSKTFEEGIGSFGRESGEDTGDRTNYDDVDDYDDWSSPPEDAGGVALSAYSDLTRSVVVRNVADDDYSSGQSGGSTGSKEITVTISKGGNDLVELSMVAVRLRY
jgi:prepilin-type N-terminal cleavage/methylation domain-containing protein